MATGVVAEPTRAVQAVTVYVYAAADVGDLAHVPLRLIRGSAGEYVYGAMLPGSDHAATAADTRALFVRMLHRCGIPALVDVVAEDTLLADADEAHAGSGAFLAMLRRERCLRHLAELPEADAAQLGLAAGLTADEVRAALGPQARSLLAHPHRVRGRATDERFLDELRRAAARVEGPLTGAEYDRIAREQGFHTRVRIVQRFGTWREACRMAGVPACPARRPVYRRRWTRAQMAHWVAVYLAEPGSRGTYAGYDGFARRTREAPSAQTVRNEFTSWATARTEALSGSFTKVGAAA